MRNFRWKKVPEDIKRRATLIERVGKACLHTDLLLLYCIFYVYLTDIYGKRGDLVCLIHVPRLVKLSASLNSLLIIKDIYPVSRSFPHLCF